MVPATLEVLRKCYPGVWRAFHTRSSYEQQVTGSAGVEETGSSGGEAWSDAEGERGRRTEIRPGDHLHPRRAMTLVQSGVLLAVGRGASSTQITCPVTPGFPRTFSQGPQKNAEAQEQVVPPMAVGVPGTGSVDSRRSHRELGLLGLACL